MENNILKHRQAVQQNIMKSFGVEVEDETIEKGFEEEINPFEMEAYKSELTKAELDEFEKAKHNDGDIHPNGKWVWRASANGGKGDWRVAKKGSSSGGSGSTGTSDGSDSKKLIGFATVSEVKSMMKMMRDYANGVDWTEENNSKAKRFLRLIPQEFRASDENIINRMNNTLRYLKQHFPELKNVVKEGDTKKSSNTVTHDINGTKVTVTKNSDGSYTLEANGKKVKSDDPSFFVNGTNIKPRVKAALAKEVGLETKKTADNKKSDEPYIYNDGGMVGGKTQIKDEAGLLKVLNNSKRNTVLIYDKDWKGLNSEAKGIGRKNGWEVEDRVDRNGNPSSTGSYIMFKKKK